MYRSSIKSKKDAAVRRILSNPTWTQDSSLYARLHALLSKMSLTDLSDLDLIIRAKEQHAAENPALWTG